MTASRSNRYSVSAAPVLMNVGIDVTSWSNRRGYGRFTRSLLTALLARPRGHDFTLFVDEPSAPLLTHTGRANITVVRTRRAPSEAAAASGSRSAADLVAMSRAVSTARLDAMVFPTVYTYFPVFSRARVVVGIHDTIAEDHGEAVFPDLRGRCFWRAKSALARFQAQRLFTVSEYARERVAARFGQTAGRIAVVGEAPGSEFRPLAAHEIDEALLARHGLTRSSRYLIYVGGINPHKNLARLVEAFDELKREEAFRDLGLVIVGEIERELFTPGLPALRGQVAKSHSRDAIRFTGYVPDSDLVTLLSCARALVLPSLAEGFGLPAVEAAACGVPCVATRESPLPAILAGGGLFVDPASTAGIASALRRICGDDVLHGRLAAEALAAAGRLSWERSAQQFVQILDSLERAP